MSRFTLRALLALTTCVAIVAAYIVSNQRIASQEALAIQQIDDRMLVHHVGGLSSGCVCGNWSGVRIVSESNAPRFLQETLRNLGITAFSRVRKVTVPLDCDPEIIAQLSQFKSLRSVTIEQLRPPAFLYFDPDLQLIAGALRTFATLHPAVSVEIPNAELLGAEYERRYGRMPSIADPFGDADPFSDTSNSNPFEDSEITAIESVVQQLHWSNEVSPNSMFNPKTTVDRSFDELLDMIEQTVKPTGWQTIGR